MQSHDLRYAIRPADERGYPIVLAGRLRQRDLPLRKCGGQLVEVLDSVFGFDFLIVGAQLACHGREEYEIPPPDARDWQAWRCRNFVGEMSEVGR